MSIANCPECAAEINLAKGTEISEILVCPDCAVQLAPMEDEDWGE